MPHGEAEVKCEVWECPNCDHVVSARSYRALREAARDHLKFMVARGLFEIYGMHDNSPSAYAHIGRGPIA